MNAPMWLHPLLAALERQPLLGRLFFASVEFAALALIVGLFIFVLRLRQPRLRALLWLVVLAKPLAGLAIGTPLPLLALKWSAPAQETRLGFDPAGMPGPGFATDISPRAIQVGPLRGQMDGMDSMNSMDSMNPSMDTLLIGVWGMGVVVFALRLLMGRLRLGRIIRGAAPPSEGLAGRLEALARELGLARAPRCGVTPVLESPALAGTWRPVILLPAWVDEEADPQRLAWSLRHELMHWRLRDPIAATIVDIVRVLFFFHPAAWWAGARWQEATELACDRALIRSAGDVSAYAEQLVGLLMMIHARRRVRVFGGLFAGRTQIARRIASLARDPLGTPARLSALTIGLVIAFSAISLTVGCGLKMQPAPEEKKAETTAAPTVRPPVSKPMDGSFPLQTLRADAIEVDDQTGIIKMSGKCMVTINIKGNIGIVGDAMTLAPTSSGMRLTVINNNLEATQADLLERMQKKQTFQFDNTGKMISDPLVSRWLTLDALEYDKAWDTLKMKGISEAAMRSIRTWEIRTRDEEIVPHVREEIRLQEKSWAEIKSKLEESSAVFTPEGESLREAQELFREGELSKAEEAYRKASSNRYLAAEAWKGLGWAIALQDPKRAEEARGAFQKALEGLPEDSMALAGMGLALKHAGNPKGAEEYASRALAADPVNTWAMLILGSLALERGDTTLARSFTAQMRRVAEASSNPENWSRTMSQARAIDYQARRVDLKRQGKQAPDLLFEDLEIESIWPWDAHASSGQRVSDPFNRMSGTAVRITRDEQAKIIQMEGDAEMIEKVAGGLRIRSRADVIRITRNPKDGSPRFAMSMLAGSKRKPEIMALDAKTTAGAGRSRAGGPPAASTPSVRAQTNRNGTTAPAARFEDFRIEPDPRQGRIHVRHPGLDLEMEAGRVTTYPESGKILLEDKVRVGQGKATMTADSAILTVKDGKTTVRLDGHANSVQDQGDGKEMHAEGDWIQIDIPGGGAQPNVSIGAYDKDKLVRIGQRKKADATTSSLGRAAAPGDRGID